MEFGIGKGNAVQHDRHQHISAAVGDEFQPTFHRLHIAGGVEYDVEEFTPGQFRQPGLVFRADGDCVRHVEGLAAKRQAVFARVQYRHLAVLELGEQRCGDADRPGADHQHVLACSHIGAAHGVRADRQEFQHGGVVEGDAVGLEHETLRQCQVLCHAAVAVHAQHLDIGAAIGLALAAGDAGAAGQVRHHVDLVAGRQFAAEGRADHFARQFVPHDPRILEEGLGAAEDVHVGAAQANAAHAQQHLALGSLRQWALYQLQVARRLAYDGFHHGFFSVSKLGCACIVRHICHTIELSMQQFF